MIRVDRRLLAWIVSVGLACVGVVILVRAFWPSMFSQGAGLGAVSFGLFPSPGVWPLVVGNTALSVIARRRGGRPRSIGSFCLWTIGILLVLSVAVSLTPPTMFQTAKVELMIPLFLLLGMAASLPMQLFILALLTFAVIGSSRAGAVSHTR